MLALGKEDQIQSNQGVAGGEKKGVQEGQTPGPGAATRCDGDGTVTESQTKSRWWTGPRPATGDALALEL